ncbi:MAG: class II fructose-bisphosphate aldolase [Desulfocurvibacter africanus]
MPLVTLRELGAGLQLPGQAFGCFSVYNLEFLQGVLEAAEDARTGTVLSINGSLLSAPGTDIMATVALSMARMAKIPVAVHLNHARRLDLVLKALELGFSSVMFDGSDLSLEENIALTRRAAQLARSFGATVEGELGPLDVDAIRERHGQPILALADRFCMETGIDYMAVSIPTNPDNQVGPRLDFLQQMFERWKVGLVLHGASAMGENDLAQAVRNGVSKVNVHTELKRAFHEGLKKGKSDNPYDLSRAWVEAKQHVRHYVGNKIRFLMSCGQAADIKVTEQADE